MASLTEYRNTALVLSQRLRRGSSVQLRASARALFRTRPATWIADRVEIERAAERRAAERRERALATEQWNTRRRNESLETMRRLIARSGASSSTWQVYGARLLEAGRPDAAFEALKSAHDLDPLNLEALELVLEMARVRGAKNSVRNQAIDELCARLGSAPRAHREAISFLIPVRQRGVLDDLKHSDDAVVRAVVELDPLGSPTPDWRDRQRRAGLAPEEIVLAEAIYALGRGRAKGAVALLEALPPEHLPKRAIRLAVRRALAAGKAPAAHSLLEQYLRVAPDDRWARSKYTQTRSGVRTDRQLTQRGFAFPAAAPSPSYDAEQARVLYPVYNSLPYHSAGYATRTQGLLDALNSHGWQTRAVTRLGYPYDMPGYRELERVPVKEVIGDVEYRRLDAQRRVVSRKPLDIYVRTYADALVRHAREFRPAILHGASNYANGLSTVLAARELGIPSVYEVRGLWEITRLSREPAWGDTEEFQFMVRMETEAAQAATSVIAITNALKDELIRRGVPGEKIVVVPNGVDPTRFAPEERDVALARELELGDRTIIGYIGSVLDYEGLDLLVEAARLLRGSRDDFALLIVGDGPKLSSLRAQVDEAGLGDIVRFTGRVPHADVHRYYSLIDIAPFPRHSLPVCEMVSPLKPFEAMAMGKAVVASDVAALAEIVNDGQTGRLHRKGDAASLAAVLDEMLHNEGERHKMGEASRQWVTDTRSWSALGQLVTDVYRGLQ